MNNDLKKLNDDAVNFAKNVVKNKQNLGFNFENVYCYPDKMGTPIYWKLRAKNPQTGDKFIRAFSLSKEGFVLKEPDFETVYPSGLGKKPLYALPHLNCSDQQSIYVVEGEQKAELLNNLGLYATTCGGCQTVLKTDLTPLNGRKIIVWPDNDDAGLKYLDDLADQLQEKAISFDVVNLSELNLEAKDDVVNWVKKRNEKGLSTQATDIQSLNTTSYQRKPNSDVVVSKLQDRSEKSLMPTMNYGNGQFEVMSSGIYYAKHDDEKVSRLWLSTPILVLAKTRDQSSNDWGRLLQWKDDAKVQHTWALPMETLQTDGAEMRKALAHMGVTLSISKYERNLFQTYLANYPVDKFAICVNRVGWHGKQYVLPNEVIGESDELLVYQSTTSVIDKYIQKGLLEDWQLHVSKYAENHDFLVLAISSAFAGQLLEPIGRNGAGIHFKGRSSKGKSTAVFIACSVWGNPETYYHTWRNTSNALEQTAFTHNDGLLVLDEIGEVPNPKDLGNIVYMLINGSGKGRMNKTLTLRETARWKLVFLSSGEKTLSELMNEVGQQSKLGQEIRLINIDIDQSEYGIFDQIDFAQSAAQQALLLNTNIKQYYGTAGFAWLKYITSDKQKLTDQACNLLNEYENLLLQGNKQGHIVRVANYFALVAVSGELATKAGITAWKTGTAFKAVQTVFNQWIGNFEQVGDYEDIEILSQVRMFFTLHGNSRFEMVDTEFNEQTRIINRLGFIKNESGVRKFFVYPETFKHEICKSLNAKVVAKVLKKHEWIECEKKSLTRVKRLPNSEKPTRFYVFNSDVMMNFNIDEEDDENISN